MKANKYLTFAFLLYTLLWALFANSLIDGINTDSISYISISKKYFDGNFSEAVNAYWGPLFSWLILPSFLFGIEPHIFVRILFAVLSFIFLFLVDRFSINLKLNDKIRTLVIYFFVLPAIFFSFYRLTPDYILLILVLTYVYLTLQNNFWNKKSFIVLSSFLGVMMYLTKSYGFMFFLVFQTILILMEFLLNKQINRRILFNYILSIVVFIILVSPWIYLLSSKYGDFTFSTSGKINIRIVNPDLNFRHPPIESGFVIPSDMYSVSAWDDPDLNAYPQWSPFTSIENLKHFTSNTLKNIIKFLIFVLAFAPLITPLIFFIKKNQITDPVLLKILLAGLIYGLGYTTIYVENRYIWPSFIFFTLIGFAVLNSFYHLLTKRNYRFLFASLLIVISFLPFFTYGVNQQITETTMYNQAKRINNELGIKGNFGSTNYWHHALAISYFLNSKFFGTEKLPINNPELLEKAKKYGINYILDYSSYSQPVTGLKFIGKVDSISIYKVDDY